MPVTCFMVEERNRRPNPDLPRLLEEQGGGPVKISDWYRVDTGEKIEGRPWNAEPGAMWFATVHHVPAFYPHPGPNLHVVCPDGTVWNIDMRATNCTRPDDDTHHCWCRHGEPPNVTVDKNGDTCQAGAGSIATPGYHGFLRNGEFT